MPDSVRPARLPLRTELVLGIALLGAILVTYLWLVFGPFTERRFLDHGDDLLERTAADMRVLVAENAATSRDLLRDVVEHSMDARRRNLDDLPLQLYGGDIARIRAAISEHDARRASTSQHNLEVLRHEMEARALARIDAQVTALRDEQTQRAASFASDLRGSSLWIVGSALAVSVLVLGFGLDRLVVRPLRELRAATRRIAGGDLSVAVDTRSLDEVGELATDFRAMVSQLRASRDEIQRQHTELEASARTLEDEVRRKTSHLERALDDLRSAQQQLLRADRMAALGTLAGGIAHEFNNVIGGIRGCVDEVLRTETDPARRESLEIVQRAADRGAGITQKLLRFARTRPERTEPTPLARLAAEVLDLVEPQARQLGITVERDFDESVMADVDAGGMHQVLLNLVTNALQAMPSGSGRLRIEIAASDAPNLAILRVADTGNGIPADRIERVFDPFYTSKDREPDPFRRGSGLGLSVSYGIVESFGGTIRVASEVGVGSTFTVELPRAAIPPATSTGPFGNEHP